KGGGGKQAVPAGPVPRTADGKPDMSGFWGGVQPGGVTSIEPAAPRGGGGGAGKGKGGPPGGGGPGGAPGAGPGGGAPAVAGGAPGGGPGGPGRGAPGCGGPGGGGGGRANSIVDPADGKVPYTPEARKKSDDLIANGM